MPFFLIYSSCKIYHFLIMIKYIAIREDLALLFSLGIFTPISKRHWNWARSSLSISYLGAKDKNLYLV